MIDICKKTLTALNDSQSNGVSAILMTKNYNTSIEAAKTVFNNYELIGWKDHSEPWVYEKTSR